MNMAKADTYKMESGGYSFENCEVCGTEASYRAFYYPTVFNGDAEWLGDFCELHKHADMKKLTPKE